MILATKFQGQGTEVPDDFFEPRNKERSIQALETLIWLASGRRDSTLWYQQTRDILDELEKRGLKDWYEAAYQRAKAS